MANKMNKKRKDKIASGEIIMPSNKASGTNAGTYRHDVSDDELINLHKSGASLRQIGKAVGMEHHAVKNRLIKAGVSFNVNAKKDTTGFVFDIEKALELYNGGYSCNAISKELGGDSKVVKRHLQKAGIVFEQSNYSRKSLDDKIGRIKELYDRGFNYTEIGNALKTTGTTIKAYLVKAGIVK
jgi:transposase-like protein